MASIGLFFGSDEGNSERIAYRIQKRFGEDVVDVIDIADATQLDFFKYERIILGIPTWDFGQIQSDWEEFWNDISLVDFSDKTVAFFGLGDQFGYSDYFLDAMGMLHDIVAKTCGNIIGRWSTAGYEFNSSKAEISGAGQFVGLALDEDHQEHLTAARLNQWCEQIRAEFGLDCAINNLDD